MDALWNYVRDQKGGHDIDHVRRVYQWAHRLAANEPGVDYDILRPAVILHDIAREDEDADLSGKTDHAKLGAIKAAEILTREGYTSSQIRHICACIASHRYSSDDTPPESIEAKILFDADKLDGLGAIGLARLLMLAGQYGERLYVKPPQGFGDGGRTTFRITDLSEYSANLEYLGKMRYVPDRLLLEQSRTIGKGMLAPMADFFALLEKEFLELEQAAAFPASSAHWVQAPQKANGNDKSLEKPIPAGNIVLYTDGACKRNPGPGGWGYVLMFGEHRKEDSGGKTRTTNNEMELTAVIRGLEALTKPSTVDLYSDSKYIIDALTKGWAVKWRQNGWIKSDKQPAKNQELWSRLLTLAETHRLRPHWVKGHADNEHNNRCDQLATEQAARFDQM